MTMRPCSIGLGLWAAAQERRCLCVQRRGKYIESQSTLSPISKYRGFSVYSVNKTGGGKCLYLGQMRQAAVEHLLSPFSTPFFRVKWHLWLWVLFITDFLVIPAMVTSLLQLAVGLHMYNERRLVQITEYRSFSSSGKNSTRENTKWIWPWRYAQHAGRLNSFPFVQLYNGSMMHDKMVSVSLFRIRKEFLKRWK